MANYLKDIIADEALLAYPYDSKFEYHSLLQVCSDFQGKDLISLKDWKEIAFRRFAFAEEQSALYYQVFSSIFSKSDQKEQGNFLPVPFVLFLYNQLFNAPGGMPSSLTKADSEFPNNGKEEAHDPLGPLVYPHFSSRSSIVSLDDLDDDPTTCKSFPTMILEKRHKLAAFWRSSVKKWLHLVFATLEGAESDPYLMDIASLIEKLQYLELFFTPVSLHSGSVEYESVRTRFTLWLFSSKDDCAFVDPKPASSPSSSSLKFSSHPHSLFIQSSFSSLVSFYFQGQESYLTLDNLSAWLQWTIMEKPAYYEVLEITGTGATSSSTDIVTNQIFANLEAPDVLISRKRGMAVCIHSKAIGPGRKFILHRLQNCEVYIMGPIDSLIISKCRNSTIFAGAVQGPISVKSSAKVFLSANCRRITFQEEDISALKMTGGIKAFINSLSRPIVEGGNVLNEVFLTLSPCNTFYKGILADLKSINHDVSINYWDQPFTLSSDPFTYSILAPSKFEFSEVPFDFKDADGVNAAKAAEQMSLGQIIEELDQNVEYQQLVEYLPPNYSAWVLGSAVFSTNVQSILKKAHDIDPQFTSRIQRHFDNWLGLSNPKGGSVYRMAKSGPSPVQSTSVASTQKS